MTHLTNLRRSKCIRDQEKERQKEAKKKRSADSYDWHALVTERKLSSLLVMELDKYLEKNSLSKRGRKADKVERITSHVLTHSTVHHQPATKEPVPQTTPPAMLLSEDSDTSSGSEEDEVLVCIGATSDTSSNSDSCEEQESL